MTTMHQTEVSCAVCGEITEICEMVSTNTLGPSDLDGRPAEMKRSTIDYWVCRCPSCGYCAPDLSIAPPGIVDVIRGESYREALDKIDLPAKCNEFLCYAEVGKASGDLGAAVWATIHAAWVCDDAEHQAGAVRCRLQAESLGRAAEMKGLEWVNPATGAAALRGDLLRRAGAFPEAQAVIDSALAAFPALADPFFRSFLRFEQSLLTAGDRSAHTVDEIPQNEDTLCEEKQGSRTPRAAFSRQQRQQFARLLRAERWIQRRARRSVDRGDALYRIYRRLRRGLIEALRAALFSVGDKAAGGYRWPDLLQRVAEFLPTTPKEQQALDIVAAMPFRPDEPAWRTGRDALTEYLAASRHHRTATSTVQGLAGKVAGAALGIRDGRWLRLASGKTCKLLRWNGITALLGDVGARGVIDYFDVLAAIEKDALTWIDAASEIEHLEAQLVSPIPERLKHLVDDRTKAEDEENARRDELQHDPLRSGMVFLQETEIAGLHYHQAKSVGARLVRGMRLQLMREADNAYDTEAVAVLMASGEKLGYVPRGGNAGIARRLDAGGALGAWLADIAWSRNDPSAKHPWRLNVEIRSSLPGDTPDSAKLGATTEPTSTPASTPTSQRAARSYWPAQFAFSGIDKARAALGRNAPGEMCSHVDTAYRWAEEAWLFQHDQTPETGRGWQAIAFQFSRATGDSGLASEGALLKQELAWRSRIAQSPKRDTALALCLLRIESLWRQNLAEVDMADARGGGGVSMSIGLPPPPPLRLPPDIPLARRYASLRRIEALRPLRQLLRVIQRVECGLSASTADLRGLTLFNRDRTLVQAILRQLAHALRESLRSLLKPTEEGICWEPDEYYARLFPFLIPNAAKWHLVNEAAALLEPEAQDISAQRALQAQLYLMQPQAHRVGRNRRRRPTDHDLFVTEQLLYSAHTLDMRDVVNGTCPAMPMDRHNRLLLSPLWRLFDAFSAELFGKRRVEMLRDYPALLTEEAAPLDFAITAWCREAEVATDADKPAERAAGLLLLEALVGHSGRWPDDLGNRIPLLERLCPL